MSTVWQCEISVIKLIRSSLQFEAIYVRETIYAATKKWTTTSDYTHVILLSRSIQTSVHGHPVLDHSKQLMLVTCFTANCLCFKQ